MIDLEAREALLLEEVDLEDRPVLEQLLQNYIKEFSTFSYQEKDASGRYLYPYLNHYWQDPDRHPYFIKQGGLVSGFALVRKSLDHADDTENDTMELAEFYITDSNRRRGKGQQAAVKLWDCFPSRWKVSIMIKNQGALQFWAKTISDYSQDQFEVIDDEKKGITTYTFSSSVL